MLNRVLAPFVGTLAIAAALTLPSNNAYAFNCSVPGIFSSAKKTVCANPALAAADKSETARFAVMRVKLNPVSANLLLRDRTSFIATRDSCKRDVRCHEATYRAQLRLYRKVDSCTKRGDEQQACVSKTIDAHRQELHRSL